MEALSKVRPELPNSRKSSASRAETCSEFFLTARSRRVSSRDLRWSAMFMVMPLF